MPEAASSTSAGAPREFLTAEWRYLALLNYQADPHLLQPMAPRGAELDHWEGRCFISLVGFRFLRTRVLGIPIPFHRDFDEVNLRFYVRRKEGAEVRRGVVFVREIVPRWAIAALARGVYNEQYVSLPMSHRVEPLTGGGANVSYAWRTLAGWNRISLEAAGEPQLPAEGSEEQFIAEHYWGYTRQRDGGTVEYRVEHPPWRVWRCDTAGFAGDVTQLYGRELAGIVHQPPASAFLAEGSAVTVYRGRRIA